MKCRTLLSFLVGAAALTATSASAIIVTVSTDKPSYYPGERLEILVTAPEP